MNVFKIPDEMTTQYKGAGIVLATTDPQDQVTSLTYLRDIIPGFDDDIDSLPSLAYSATVAKCVKDLEHTTGYVRLGLAGSWEFNEL